MRIYDIIIRKRDGLRLSDEEIRFFVDGFTNGKIPDYQAAALMMAIFIRGMDPAETLALTKAMVHSGKIMDLSGIMGIKVDKHSTGGVGDKTSIVLGPMVAAAGVPVAKLSGRGLGHTGGTIDKLESFPGFSVEMSMDEFVGNVNTVGIAMGGQTADLAPADKQLYALRDVTGTVENTALIAGSIMSKKLASGADAILLDVKCGSGAFMKDLDQAKELAQAMVEIGRGMGKETVAIVSNMDQPLGYAIGNALEVKEAIQSLQGNGPADFMELCFGLGTQMLMLGGITSDEASARKILEDTIHSGKAFEKLKEFIAAQKGDPSPADHPEKLPSASLKFKFKAESSGFVSRIDAEGIGMTSMILGAGRETKEDKLDLGAGVLLEKKVGDKVEQGECLAVLHLNDDTKLKSALERIKSSFEVSAVPPEPRSMIQAIIR